MAAETVNKTTATSEEQIKDLTALLLDPASPVNQ